MQFWDTPNFLCLFVSLICVHPGFMCIYLFMCAYSQCRWCREGELERGILVSTRETVEKVRDTPSWSHFRFHVSSCPSPKWPITIISLLVVVMLVRERERGRERERERAMLKEPRANEMEAAEISQKIIPYLHCIEIKQHPPWQKVNPLSAWEIESFRWVLLVCGYTQRLLLC